MGLICLSHLDNFIIVVGARLRRWLPSHICMDFSSLLITLVIRVCGVGMKVLMNEGTGLLRSKARASGHF